MKIRFHTLRDLPTGFGDNAVVIDGRARAAVPGSRGDERLRIRRPARRRRAPAGQLVQLLKFGIVGGSGYLINLAVFAVLAGNLGVHHSIAAVGAFCVAVTSNFLWNRYWTFGPGDGPAGFQAARFFAVSLASLAINLVVLEALRRRRRDRAT